MLSTAIALIALAHVGPTKPLCCPATLEEVKAPAVTMEYGGALFGTCCADCEAPFAKDPSALLAKAIKANKAVGAFEYDPVSGFKIDSQKAAAFSDYKAIRYFFAEASEKKTFDASPAKFVSDVKSESYFCPIMSQPTTSKDAAGFVEYKGVRYYTCCTICVKMFHKNPSKYMENMAKGVKPLAVVTIKK